MPTAHAAQRPHGTDADIRRREHRFVRLVEEDAAATPEQRIAISYCSRIFKEYAIADMSRYKKEQIGLRWCTEAEVLADTGAIRLRCEAMHAHKRFGFVRGSLCIHGSWPAEADAGEAARVP
jgi:hypothetical protein